jgi:hypothetical protein
MAGRKLGCSPDERDFMQPTILLAPRGTSLALLQWSHLDKDSKHPDDPDPITREAEEQEEGPAGLQDPRCPKAAHNIMAKRRQIESIQERAVCSPSLPGSRRTRSRSPHHLRLVSLKRTDWKARGSAGRDFSARMPGGTHDVATWSRDTKVMCSARVARAQPQKSRGVTATTVHGIRHIETPRNNAMLLEEGGPPT